MALHNLKWGKSALLFLLLTVSALQAGNFSLTSTLGMSRGDYFYNQALNNYLFSLGGRYTTEKWSFATYVSYLLQNNDQTRRVGGMLLPADGSHNNGQHGNMMGESGMMSDTHTLLGGLGDWYVYGTYRLLSSGKRMPEVQLAAQIKIPTASTNNGFGSGKTDFCGGLAFRKSVQRWLFYSEVGYSWLGDPAGVVYLDSWRFSFGTGYVFVPQRFSAMVNYYNYGKILSGYAAPAELGFTGYLKLGEGRNLLLLISRGLNDLAADFSLSFGIEQSF